VCAVAAAGLLFQAGVLAATAGKGFKQERRELGPFLTAAARVVPPGVDIASNLYAAGYALYPRRRVNIRFNDSEKNLRAHLRKAGIRYLVMSVPLPRSMGDPGTWTRRLYEGHHGVVLEIR
jgi:hypothetical protein